MILIASVLLLCINLVLCEDWVRDNGSRDLNMERKLNRDLLQNYDPFQSPQNSTSVTVRFILRHFFFDSKEEIFNMHSWVSISWVDERLQWDPQHYDDISEMQYEDYNSIWTPKLKHKNNIVYEDFEGIMNYPCRVINSGRVTCTIKVLSQSECSTNLTNWPFDTQSCSLKFGVYTNYKSNAVFTFNSSRGISMFGAEYGPGWNIIDFDKGENATSETQFHFTFVVERQGKSIEAVTVIPSLVLSVLTVSSLFLDINNTRKGIAILSLLCHFYIKTFIIINIPKYTSTTPLILRFIAVSLVLATINIVLTFGLSYLRRKEVPPHTWIVLVNDIVYKTPLKFLIQPRWEAEDLKSKTDETKKAVEIWTGLTNVINSASIIIETIVYVSISLSLMPKEIPIDYSS